MGRSAQRTSVTQWGSSEGDLFTDRKLESTALKHSLAAHRKNIDGTLDSSARNVLVFYGVGGVGKTTLSERLDAWIDGRLSLDDGWGFQPDTHVDASVRIDLHGSGGQFDVLAAVLAIRHGVGGLKKSWPAFDLAFAAYWSAAHPGEDLPEFRHRGSEFSDTIAETIGNVVSDIGVLDTAIGVGVRSIRALVAEVSRRSLRRLAFESIENYVDLLERCAELPAKSEPHLDLLVELVELIDVDLERWPTGQRPMLVIFVDTIERLVADPRRSGEAILNKIVYLLPSALFVMTGRNMLDWHEARRHELKHSGPRVWPLLVPGSDVEPRQHLLGKLSPSDARELILRRRKHFDLPISDAVVEELVTSSGGLPQYLDLACTVALKVKENGGTAVSAEDITGSLGELVMRVLEDVPADEQRAIRAAALFPFFDVPLIASAAGVDHGTAERAVLRPMIDHREGASLPYRMHDEIRNAIRSSDHRISGGWAAGDWKAAASRALGEIRRRHDNALEREDSVGCLTELGVAIGIVCRENADIGPSSEADEYADWLTRAIVLGPTVSGLYAYVPTSSETAYGATVIEYIRAKTYADPPEVRQATFRRVFESPHPLAQPAGRSLAYSLRNDAQFDQSVAVFDELVARDPGEVHTYQRSFTLVLARRFRDALDLVDSVSEPRLVRLNAHIAASHGLPAEILRLKPAIVEKHRVDRNRREYLEEKGELLRLTALVTGDLDENELATFAAEADAVGHPIAIQDALCAQILMRPFASDVHHTLDRLATIDLAANEDGSGFRSSLALAAIAFASDDRDTLERLSQRSAVAHKPRERQWIPVECLLDSLGLPLSTRTETQWLEPYELVRARWRGVFDRLRDRVRT